MYWSHSAQYNQESTSSKCIGRNDTHSSDMRSYFLVKMQIIKKQVLLSWKLYLDTESRSTEKTDRIFFGKLYFRQLFDTDMKMKIERLHSLQNLKKMYLSI